VIRRSVFLAALLFACVPYAGAQSTLITGALVVDGSGSPGVAASVRIQGDRIVDVGDLKPRAGEHVISAKGYVLAPGFIDTHSHADEDIFKHPDAIAAVSQGITTVVVGQDGESVYPLRDFFAKLEQLPPAVNVASYAGHGTVRGMVMGKDFRRHATPAEVDSMHKLLDVEILAGALGLSSGLEYDPGIYSDSTELFTLTDVFALSGSRYISHIRSEDRYYWPAIDEIVAIGRRSRIPVQVSHTKLAMKAIWGQHDSLLHVLDRARDDGVLITADVYPYTYWQSGLTVLFPSRDFDDRTSAAFALAQVAPADGLLLTHYGPNPAYNDKTIAQIAQMRHEDDTTTLMALIRDGEAARAKDSTAGEMTVIGTSMVEPDVEAILKWPWSNVCTDGELDGKHPRGYGAFTRVLGVYVRDRHVLPLEEAIRKMSWLAATNVGIKERGRISVGMFADLVLFDPKKVADRATLKEPHALSAGVKEVWVNGLPVYLDGKITGALPGRALRRQNK
jgi:N-acyl-D-amino-acid deacylase